MGLDIVWTFRAREDVKSITLYWNTKNRSTLYSQKLKKLTNKQFALLSDYPFWENPQDTRLSDLSLSEIIKSFIPLKQM